MLKKSGSGIRLLTEEGEVTLEELCDEEDAKELGETVAGDALHFYSRPSDRIYHKGKGGRTVVTQFYNQNAINRENYRRMKVRRMEAKDLNKAICAALSTGDKFTVKQMYDELVEKGLELDMNAFQSRLSYLTCKTRVKYLVESGKVGGSTAKYYTLKPPFRGLTSQELLVISYSKKLMKSEYEEFCARNGEIYKYLTIMEEKNGSEAPKEVEEVEDTNGLDVVLKEDNEKKIPAPITSAIEQIVKESTGIDINISGKVEVVFKFQIS